MGYKSIGICSIFLMLIIILISGAAFAENRTLEIIVNGQPTNRIDTNKTANISITFTNPYYRINSNKYKTQINLYLPPNNATNYSALATLKLNYGALASACTLYTSSSQFTSTPDCYYNSGWSSCTSVPQSANVTILRCYREYSNLSYTAPQKITLALPETAPLVTEDLKSRWTGRDYNITAKNNDPQLTPVNEYWGNTTTATPYINITSATSQAQKINLGQTFYYNVTVRNENVTNHTGKAYAVFLYPLTDGITIVSSSPQKYDITTNGSITYYVGMTANRTMGSFLLAAGDNGTAQRAIFNSTINITFNITNQLALGIVEPTNQSYDGGARISISANITDINGNDIAATTAYANITGIANGVPLAYAGVLYRGNYTIGSTQPTPWELVFYAADTYGNLGSNTTLFYDKIPPAAENATAPAITDRQNATLNASAWDALGIAGVDAQVFWATTGLIKNYTMSNYSRTGYSVLIPSAEVVPGTHNIRIFARDPSGNTNSSATTTLIVNDTTPPTLENISITDATENQQALVNASAWDIMNVSRVWVQINSGANYSMVKQGGTTYNVNLPLLSAGTYGLKIYANDTSGNTNYTTGTLRINDTTPPTIAVIRPESGAQLRYGQNQSVIANVTDNYEGVDKVWVVVDSNQSKTYGLTYYNGLYLHNISETVGIHLLNIYANDTRNNTANASAYFTVFAEATISSLEPTLQSPQNAGTNITWVATLQDAYGTIYYQYNISRDGGTTWRTARDWNESNTFTWRTNASDSGMSLVRVYISNTTSITGNRTSAPYNISTSYRIDAAQLQYSIYMRGENITFAAKFFGVQNNEIADLQASARLTEGYATLEYNGSYYTGRLTVPTNATTGNWTANISAADTYNSGSLLIAFNVSGQYSVELAEPYENDNYLRGDSAIVNLTVKNIRGELQQNLSGASAYLKKGTSTKQAVGLTHAKEHYLLYFPFAFNTTDSEGAWEVFANVSNAGNTGNASRNIVLNATLLLSANPATSEIYNSISLNFTIGRGDTLRQQENATISSDAYFWLNNTEAIIASYAVAIGNTPLTLSYTYDSDKNGTSVNKTGQWKLRINISNNKNYGETETTIYVADTQQPILKKIGIADQYLGHYFENSAGARAYPNDTLAIQAEYTDNFNTSGVNITLTSPSGTNTTLSMEKYWSKDCVLGSLQQDCDDTAGSAFRGSVYHRSKWNVSFSDTAETGNYTITKTDGWDSAGNLNTTHPGYSFEIQPIQIGIGTNPAETNISTPVEITANISGNLTAISYVRINISGTEGSFEYQLNNISYIPTRSGMHTVTVKIKSADYLAEATAQFFVNYGTPALATKLADDQTQLNGTYKTVNMSITAVGGDLGNVRIGSTTTDESILTPSFDADTLGVIGDIQSSETAVFPFGFTANETGTVNITIMVLADLAKVMELDFIYHNYSIVQADTSPPEIIYLNTTTTAGYASINESVKIYAKITDNVEVSNASVTINCTNPAYNKTEAQLGEDTINTEHVWAYQFNFTAGPANCTFNVSATDTSGQQAPTKQTTLNASTAYAVTAAKTGADLPLMRGETINTTATIKTINNRPVEGASLSYNLTRPDNTTEAWTGEYQSGYNIRQSDPDGQYLLKINASKYGNTGEYTLGFSINSSLILEPNYAQGIQRGSLFVFNTSIKNARGEPYDAAVNLTFLGQTTQLSKTFALYTHTQQVQMATQLGSTNLTIFAYVNNNTATAILPASILPANLTIQEIRVDNTLRQDLAIGRGDNITITLELYAQNGEGISGANITAQASTGEAVNFTYQYGSKYAATAIINISHNSAWSLNLTAQYREDNPASTQISIIPINKKWRDVDQDSQLEFAEDRNWLETYDAYGDTSLYLGMYSREFYHFPLSPHNGFLIVTPLSSAQTVPDKFWSPYDDVNTTVAYLDLSQSQGNGPANPYEYYVDINGDGNFERQYADGMLNTISGKKLVYGAQNQTHLYAFDLQNIGRYDKVYDIKGDTTIFCGGARYTMLGYILGNSEQSEYILGKDNSNIPNWYWDAKTNTGYPIFNEAQNLYYVEADGIFQKSSGDLVISTSNNTCSFTIFACGNGQCQSQYGETTVTCPQDCQSTQTTPNSPGGGSSPPSGAPAAVTPAPNVTETEREGLEVIIQAPTNLLVTQGTNLTFQITLASTAREYPLGVSFKTDCCEYTYTPETLTLYKGGSAEVSVKIVTALSTKAGEYTGEFAIAYKNYTKSRSISIKVEANPAVFELSDLKSRTLLLKESLRQLNQTSDETKKAEEDYAILISEIEKAEKAVEENDPTRLGSILKQANARQQNLQDTMKVLMKKQGIIEQQAASVLPEQPSYLWIIALVTILVIGSAASVVFREQIQQNVFKKTPEEELKERVAELTSEEARITHMKKTTEREYFSRKLDQKTFLHLMSDYESKQIDIKTRLAEAHQKLAELTKPKSEKEKVELLELQNMPEGKKLMEQTRKIGRELEKGDYTRALEEYRSALDAYNNACKSLPLEEQGYLYDELNKEYSKLEEFRNAAKKTGDLYSALRNCKNCVSSEKYDLARHFFEQAQPLHKELAGSDFYRKHAQHEEIEKLYKEISEFHKTGE